MLEHGNSQDTSNNHGDDRLEGSTGADNRMLVLAVRLALLKVGVAGGLVGTGLGDALVAGVGALILTAGCGGRLGSNTRRGRRLATCGLAIGEVRGTGGQIGTWLGAALTVGDLTLLLAGRRGVGRRRSSSGSWRVRACVLALGQVRGTSS